MKLALFLRLPSFHPYVNVLSRSTASRLGSQCKTASERLFGSHTRTTCVRDAQVSSPGALSDGVVRLSIPVG